MCSVTCELVHGNVYLKTVLSCAPDFYYLPVDQQPIDQQPIQKEQNTDKFQNLTSPRANRNSAPMVSGLRGRGCFHLLNGDGKFLLVHTTQFVLIAVTRKQMVTDVS
jgi:hypothetical protein